MARDVRLHALVRLCLLAALLVPSACVSEAEPRDEMDSTPDGRAGSDVREGGAGDAARTDARGTSDDADDAKDTSDESTSDADDDDDADHRDVTKDGDALGPDVTDDTTPDAGDAVVDSSISDADTREDGTEAGTALDAGDSSAPIDASDAEAPSDTGSDGNADALDATGGASDGAPDAGILVFFQENFDTGFGSFSLPVNVCGSGPPQWSPMGGYAHVSDPASTGVSRISSPPVSVPLNASNVTLRMSHKVDTESGYDAGNLLISVNSAPAILVTTFASGGYVNGGQTNPTTCALTNMPGFYAGWSGNLAEITSEVNLSAAPFNVVPSSTVTIILRMATDSTTSGAGWDINWVTLSANIP